MTIEDALKRATISIPQAGEVFFGLGRSGSYEAARRGDFPLVGSGKRKKVAVAALAQKLGLSTLIGRETT